MEATYQALRKHGYADLSISKIAEEFEKSKSLLYHHYDGKDDLLVAFLEYLIDQFAADITLDAWDDAEAQLRSFFDRLIPPALDDEQREFQTALLEIRAQAPHNEVYREQFTKTDRFIRETIEQYLESGIEQGTFREVDSEATAQLFLSMINGAILERVTADNPRAIKDLRSALNSYIEEYLAA